MLRYSHWRRRQPRVAPRSPSVASSALCSLPVWDHPSLWHISAGQHSGTRHLFKACHSGLGGPSSLAEPAVLTLWYRLCSHSPSVHRELAAGTLHLEPAHLSQWRSMPNSTMHLVCSLAPRPCVLQWWTQCARGFLARVWPTDAPIRIFRGDHSLWSAGSADQEVLLIPADGLFSVCFRFKY